MFTKTHGSIENFFLTIRHAYPRRLLKLSVVRTGQSSFTDSFQSSFTDSTWPVLQIVSTILLKLSVKEDLLKLCVVKNGPRAVAAESNESNE